MNQLVEMNRRAMRFMGCWSFAGRRGDDVSGDEDGYAVMPGGLFVSRSSERRERNRALPNAERNGELTLLLNPIPFNERGISFQLVNILCKQWRNSATG